jgi:pimeloyl-ACP methyl ester carboxylesterase
MVGRVGVLAKWLGPWIDELATPPGIVRRSAWIDTADGRRVQVWVYAPPEGRGVGVYLLASGLHYAGPADKRMDRFARVLAASGFWVVAPFVESFMGMRVRQEALRDVEAVSAWITAQPQWEGLWMGVFSVSFGSLLALKAAASDDQGRIKRLVLFGGYRDWRATMRFCATGMVNGVKVGAHDPLNFPVLMTNVLETVCDSEEGQRVLKRAWGQYVRATWGRPEMKTDKWREVAQAIGEALDPQWRSLFWIGCNHKPGGAALIEEAMHITPGLDALDPDPYFAQVRCPVTLMHGSGDDVIPSSELEQLRVALAPYTEVEPLVTGTYGHTGRSGGLRQAVSEARTTARLLWRISGR